MTDARLIEAYVEALTIPTATSERLVEAYVEVLSLNVVVVTADAALTATSSLTIIATDTVLPAVALVAASSLTPVASDVVPAAVALVGVATLTPAVSGVFSATASLTATSSLTVAATITEPAAAALVAASALTPTMAPATGVSLSAVSSLIADAVALVTAAVALSATSTLTTVGTVTAAGSDLFLAAPLAEGMLYYLRIHPDDPAQVTGTFAATWATTPRVTPLLVETLAAVLTTPAWLKATVSNGTPLDPVDFSVDGGATIFSATLDDNGQVIGISIPLPSLTAGSHTITATTPTLSATVSFTVTNPPVSYPVGLAADSPPVLVTQTGVVRWVLQDPTSGGESFIFPISPSKMSAPHAARVFASDHSTAPDGQPLTFEGAPLGVDWTIEGACRTEAFHDTLETFLAMPRRVYLIDHLNRAWTVTLESIAWTRMAEAYNDWAFTYQLKAIIYAGPVQL